MENQVTETIEAPLPIPDLADIAFGVDDVARMNARPKIRGGGTYKFKVTDAEIATSKEKSNLMLVATVVPLDGEGKAARADTRLRLSFPFANPAKAGHTAPNTIGFWHQLLRALYADKYPRYPRWDGEQKVFVSASGELLDKAGSEAEKKVIFTKLVEGIRGYYKNPKDLIDEMFYATVSNDDWRSVEVKTISGLNEPPEGVLTTDLLERVSD